MAEPARNMQRVKFRVKPELLGMLKETRDGEFRVYRAPIRLP